MKCSSSKFEEGYVEEQSLKVVDVIRAQTKKQVGRFKRRLIVEICLESTDKWTC